ncbi:cation diffusion facilitator family transporter [Candidatus Altiarchaeota archaeon]
MRQEDYPKVRKTLVIVLILNLFVAILKGVFGFLANSLSMMADSMHSFFDSTSNIIGLFGIWIASKPADSDHPYGHRKFETFATIGIALLLIITSLSILGDIWDRIIDPVIPDISHFTILVMVASMLINIMVSRYEHALGVRLGSSILRADAMHTRSDIFASLSVLLGFAAVSMGYPLFDPLIALFIAILIARTAYHIISDSCNVLCDQKVLPEHAVLKVVNSIQGIKGCHKIRTRGSENQIYVDLHMLVAKDMSVDEAHRLTELVEERLRKEINGIADVVVHIEPSED